MGYLLFNYYCMTMHLKKNQLTLHIVPPSLQYFALMLLLLMVELGVAVYLYLEKDKVLIRI